MYIIGRSVPSNSSYYSPLLLDQILKLSYLCKGEPMPFFHLNFSEVRDKSDLASNFWVWAEMPEHLLSCILDGCQPSPALRTLLSAACFFRGRTGEEYKPGLRPSLLSTHAGLEGLLASPGILYPSHTPRRNSFLKKCCSFFLWITETFGHNWDIQRFLLKAMPPKWVAEVTPTRFKCSQLESGFLPSGRGFLGREGNTIVSFVKYTC